MINTAHSTQLVKIGLVKWFSFAEPEQTDYDTELPRAEYESRVFLLMKLIWAGC